MTGGAAVGTGDCTELARLLSCCFFAADSCCCCCCICCCWCIICCWCSACVCSMVWILFNNDWSLFLSRKTTKMSWSELQLTLSMLGKNFSRRHFEMFYFFIMGTICIKCQILFSWKNKKNIINLSSAEFAQRWVKVNDIFKSVVYYSLSETQYFLKKKKNLSRRSIIVGYMFLLQKMYVVDTH